MELHTHCTRDCPDACSMLATVEDGRVVRLRGDREHPVTQGFLCFRTNRFPERQNDPSRLTRPLLKRGDGFVEIGWDEALDLAAETMLRVREESGPAAIMHYRSGGSLGLMKHVSDYFFERFGPVTVKSGDICSGAGETAQELDFGAADSHDVFDVLESNHVLLWGKNPHVASVHLLPILKQARRRGARITLIDPVHHRGASLADHVIQPRPGGDIALGMGVARLLFDGGRVAPDTASYCDHLDAFRDQALARDVQEWAALADVPLSDVAHVADALSERPCAALLGWGMQRRARGAETIRVLDALVAISGNLGIPGGGASFYFDRRGAFDTSFARGLDAAPRSIREACLGPGILEAKDPPIRVLWITAGNPVVMLPESRTVARAVETRELSVVVDSFLTDTARRARLVLPTTTMLEEDDLVGAYGHHWIGEVRPVVEPPPGVLTDYQIAQELARRVGLQDDFAGDAASWKKRMLSRVSRRGASLDDLRKGPVKNPDAGRVLYEDRTFGTPNGRVQLVSEVHPEPPAITSERPLLLMPIATDRSQGSQWPEDEQHGPAAAVVHPDAAPGFADGDRARLESEIDALEVVLAFDERQRRDVVLMDKGGWLDAGRCANTLVKARESDLGGCAVYHDTPVRLLPFRG